MVSQSHQTRSPSSPHECRGRSPSPPKKRSLWGHLHPTLKATFAVSTFCSDEITFPWYPAALQFRQYIFPTNPVTSPLLLPEKHLLFQPPEQTNCIIWIIGCRVLDPNNWEAIFNGKGKWRGTLRSGMVHYAWQRSLKLQAPTYLNSIFPPPITTVFHR